MSQVKKTTTVASKAKSSVIKTAVIKIQHPKFSDMIVDGLKLLNERSGSSRQALLKYVLSTYKLDEKKQVRISN